MKKIIVIRAVKTMLPIGLSLFPIGLLFGLLAGQVGWSYLDVLLLSSLGFTGSGQFAYLGFVSQSMAMSLSSVLVIILSMNLRYIPMSLAASAFLNIPLFQKIFMAHILADESFACETESCCTLEKLVIRLSVFIFWVVSTVLGAVFYSYIPKAFTEVLKDFSFPASAILIALSFLAIKDYVNDKKNMKKNIFIIFFSCLVAISWLYFLGIKYFWIPSIASIYFILSSARQNQN